MKLNDNITSENEVIQAKCCVKVALNTSNINITWLIETDGIYHIAKVVNLFNEPWSETNKAVCSHIGFFADRNFHQKPLKCTARNDVSTASVVTLIVECKYIRSCIVVAIYLSIFQRFRLHSDYTTMWLHTS